MAFTKPPIVVSDFSDVNEFTLSEAGTVTSTDIESSLANQGGKGVFYGSDSMHVQLVAGASGGQVRVNFDVNVPVEDSQRFLLRMFNDIPLESDDWDEGWSVGLYVGNTAGDYENGTISRFNFSTDDRARCETLIAARADFTTDLGTAVDWDLPIRAMFVELRKITDAGTIDVYLDSLFCGWELDKVPVAFSFDDATEPDPEGGTVEIGQYEFLWKTQFEPRGWLCTLAITSTLIDSSENMTMDQLREMFEAGCDVVYHGVTHNDHRLSAEGGDFANPTLMQDDIETWRSWAKTNGFERARSAKWAIMPFGNYSETTMTVFGLKGYEHFRLAGGGGIAFENYNYLPVREDGFTDVYGKEVISVNMTNTANYDTAAELLAITDSAIAKQAPVAFYGHKFPTTATTGNDFARAEALTFFAGLETREDSGSIRVTQLTTLDNTGGVSNAASSRNNRARKAGTGRR